MSVLSRGGVLNVDSDGTGHPDSVLPQAQGSRGSFGLCSHQIIIWGSSSSVKKPQRVNP